MRTRYFTTIINGLKLNNKRQYHILMIIISTYKVTETVIVVFHYSLDRFKYIQITISNIHQFLRAYYVF